MRRVFTVFGKTKQRELVHSGLTANQADFHNKPRLNCDGSMFLLGSQWDRSPYIKLPRGDAKMVILDAIKSYYCLNSNPVDESNALLTSGSRYDVDVVAFFLYIGQLDKSLAQDVSIKLDDVDKVLIRRIADASDDSFLISPIALKLAFSALAEMATGLTSYEISNIFAFDMDKEKLRKKYEPFIELLKTDSQMYIPNIGNIIYLNNYMPRIKVAMISQNNYKTHLDRIILQNLDLATSNIKSWASGVAQREIDNFVQPGDISDTSILMMNVLYFKGPWRDKFRLTSDSNKKSLMETKHKFFYSDWTKYDAKIVRIPYRDSYAMYIVVPNSPSNTSRIAEGIDELADEITNMKNVFVHVTIPKFKLESTVFLDDYLKQLGLRMAYDDEASFPKLIRPATVLKLSKVIQKCGLVVNDSGSPGIFEGFDTSNSLDPKVVADKAFLFLIQHVPSNEIILAGRLKNNVDHELGKYT